MTGPKKPQKDTLVLGAPLADEGKHSCTVFKQDGTSFPGYVRLLEEGETSEPHEVTARITHLAGNVYDYEEDPGQRGGPAMVNSSAYRSGWDTIFGSKTAVGQA